METRRGERKKKMEKLTVLMKNLIRSPLYARQRQLQLVGCGGRGAVGGVTAGDPTRFPDKHVTQLCAIISSNNYNNNDNKQLQQLWQRLRIITERADKQLLYLLNARHKSECQLHKTHARLLPTLPAPRIDPTIPNSNFNAPDSAASI